MLSVSPSSQSKASLFYCVTIVTHNTAEPMVIPNSSICRFSVVPQMLARKGDDIFVSVTNWWSCVDEFCSKDIWYTCQNE